MKVSFSLLFLILLVDCQVVWYRRLPIGDKGSVRNFTGVWEKKTNPKSAINSSWYKNKWSEKILFQSELKFLKIYETEDAVGNVLVLKQITGVGTYQTYDNWILLKTKSIRLVEKLDGQMVKNESNNVDTSLLYYYYRDENLIIPMIYDMGYNEKEFGVIDGVSKPYDEENSNFFRYIKIYAFKEFQSHAYYPQN